MEPIRCCIACRTRRKKEDFYRIVTDSQKNAILDKNHNINSRGVYICKDKKCIDNISKAIQKNKLKLKIEINDHSLLEVLKELGEEFWEK